MIHLNEIPINFCMTKVYILNPIKYCKNGT
jgi:hypothetical protein